MEQQRLEIIYLPANQLRHFDRNPRKKKDPLVLEKLRKLIEEHGFQNPLQVYKEKAGYTILCGNHRFDAATELGMTEFPCIIYEGARDKAIARTISDNKSNEWTAWDLPSLKELLLDLDTGVFKLEDITGFDPEELTIILAPIHQEGNSGGQGVGTTEQMITCPECGHVWTPSREGEQFTGNTARKET